MGDAKATRIQMTADVRNPELVEYQTVQEGEAVEVVAKAIHRELIPRGRLKEGKVNLRISLPVHTHATIRTLKGDIDVRQTIGQFHFYTSNGDSMIIDSLREYGVQTSNGDIGFEGKLIRQSHNEFCYRKRRY